MAGGGSFDPSAWPWAAGATGVLLLLGLVAIFPSAFREWWPRVFVYRGEGTVPRNAVRVWVHPSVTEIPDELFKDYDRLRSVLLHRGLLRIGERAFYRCSSLRRFRCPATVTEIGRGAFADCSNLAEVVLPEGLQSIEGWTFCECTSLEEVRIPATVAWIGERAFYCCESLREIQIPASVTRICRFAFACCTGLAHLHLDEGLETIEFDAFENCTGLKSVQMDERLESIGETAFGGCTSLKRFRFARLSERMEAVSMDHQTAVMFDERLIEIAAAMTREYDEALWGKCKRSLERAHEILAYLELKRGAMPVLEMALWKARREEVTNNGEGGHDLNGAERDAQRLDLARDVDRRTRISREECLVRCGSSVVCPGVLNFLAITSWPQLSEFGVTSTQE